jgi:hypothetical protein
MNTILTLGLSAFYIASRDTGGLHHAAACKGATFFQLPRRQKCSGKTATCEDAGEADFKN